MHLLVENAGREEEPVQKLDLAGSVPSLFDQLALGRDVWRLGRLKGSRGQLDQGLSDGDAPVANQANPAINQQRHNHTRARMAHDLTRLCFSAGGGYRLTDDAELWRGEQDLRMLLHGDQAA